MSSDLTALSSDTESENCAKLLENSGAVSENNDEIRALRDSLLTQAFEGGLLKRDEIANLQIEARALEYGLARMYIDGQFQSWKLGTDGQARGDCFLDGYLRSLKR